MKKITFLMLHLKHGGAEKQTITLMNHLVDFFQIEIISFYRFDGIPAYPIDDRIVIKYLINGGPNRDDFKNALNSKKIARIMKEGLKSIKILRKKKVLIRKAIEALDCDIAFATRLDFAFELSKYGSENILKITQEHNYITDQDYRKQVVKGLSKIDILVVMSDESARLYKQWLSDNSHIEIRIIPNMLDEMPQRTTTLNHHRIIAAGRFHPVKDFISLIDMFAILHQLNHQIELVLLGDGQQRLEIEKRIESYQLQSFVHLKGMVSLEEVEESYYQSDMFIMTSLHECFPMVLLEANASGLPSISFDIPAGPRELIQNGENGYLIQNRNIHEMAEKINELYENKEQMKLMSEKALARSKNYLPNTIMPLWLDLFDHKHINI
ncbi:MAG: glycosyltransferase [Erysipelotrichaceae bacterium]